LSSTSSYLSPLLSPYVKDIWTLESNSLAGLEHSFWFYADGCPGLMYQQTEEGMYLGTRGKLSSVFLYGQTVKPIEITTRGSYRLIVVYLYPHVLKALFGFNATELTDSCLGLELLPGAASKDLNDRLQHAGSLPAQVGLLTDYLLGLAQQSKTGVDPMLQVAIDKLLHSKGTAPLKKLQDELRITERTFERRFSEQVGVSPRLFSRICRFQASMHQLQKKNYTKLSDIAFDLGYTDQAHFVKTFKEFTGSSPNSFLKSDKFPL